MAVDTLMALKLARARIARPNGWIQNEYGYKDDPNCAIGALMQVLETNCIDILRTPAIRRLWAVAESIDGGTDLIRWNDYPGRTQKDVVELYDKAIVLEEKESGANQEATRQEK